LDRQTETQQSQVPNRTSQMDSSYPNFSNNAGTAGAAAADKNKTSAIIGAEEQKI